MCKLADQNIVRSLLEAVKNCIQYQKEHLIDIILHSQKYAQEFWEDVEKVAQEDRKILEVEYPELFLTGIS